jgi:hypothetical protein
MGFQRNRARLIDGDLRVASQFLSDIGNSRASGHWDHDRQKKQPNDAGRRRIHCLSPLCVIWRRGSPAADAVRLLSTLCGEKLRRALEARFRRFFGGWGSHALLSLVSGSDGEPRPFVRTQPMTSVHL